MIVRSITRRVIGIELRTGFGLIKYRIAKWSIGRRFLALILMRSVRVFVSGAAA